MAVHIYGRVIGFLSETIKHIWANLQYINKYKLERTFELFISKRCRDFREKGLYIIKTRSHLRISDVESRILKFIIFDINITL